MLIAAQGAAGLDEVRGVADLHPNGLLEAVGDDAPSHLAYLVPWYAEVPAKEQAHVLIAAHPTCRVAVLRLRHHPLSLTMIGAAVRASLPAGTDPGEEVRHAEQAAARTRSLVWYARALGLRDAVPTLGQRLRSLFGAPGFFRDLADERPVLRSARTGAPVADGEYVYLAGPERPQLRSQLRGTVLSVEVRVSADQPWQSRSAVPVTVLVLPVAAPGSEPACASCGAVRVGGGCAYCGRRGTAVVELDQVLPTESTELVGAGTGRPPFEVNPRPGDTDVRAEGMAG